LRDRYPLPQGDEGIVKSHTSQERPLDEMKIVNEFAANWCMVISESHAL
jgi:hypothetical protein